MTLTFGSLFAGIGGFDRGLECAGMECRWQVEIDDYCRRVLAKHWPDVKRYGDVRDVGKHNLEAVGLICGGFPCQDVSLAGKRRGLEGKRSTLWSEFYRVIREIQPRWIIIENVPGLYSSDGGRFFAKILRELAKGGYDAEWHNVFASKFRAPHHRERVFILAYSTCKPGNGSATDRIWSKPCLEQKGQPRRYDSEILPLGSDWELYQPPICGKHDGVPHRVDRLRALGNAVVPQVAEWIGRRIMETEATA